MTQLYSDILPKGNEGLEKKMAEMIVLLKAILARLESIDQGITLESFQ